MTEESDQFEKTVRNIKKLLESSDSEVTWDERVSDRARPEQERQIDVSIRRDGLFTMVECRNRGKPQDVGWIENLIGRRLRW